MTQLPSRSSSLGGSSLGVSRASGIASRVSAGGPKMSSATGTSATGKSFEELKRTIHAKLVDKLDLTKVSDLQGDVLRKEIRVFVERLCDTENPLLNRMERERLIEEVLDETLGFGPLEVLL